MELIASATNFLGSWKMVIVQACAIVLGVGIYFLMSQIDLTEASKRWKWLLGFGIVLFLLLKTPLGIENNGNRAWLGIRGFPANIQPAEIVKLTFILVLSKQLVWVKEHWGLRSLRSVAFLGGHLLLMVGLYYAISSDMGSALVYAFVFAAMAFVAGVAARWFVIALLGGGAAFYLLWELDKIPDYMKERFMVVFDHSLDPLGAGWQQTRSLLALGGGKLTGQGLFHGIQTQGEYSGSLPFRYTDFIFSAIGEELGMLGCLAVKQLRDAVTEYVRRLDSTTKNAAVKAAIAKWLETYDDLDASTPATRELLHLLESETFSAQEQALVDEILKRRKDMSKKTMWMYGGGPGAPAPAAVGPGGDAVSGAALHPGADGGVPAKGGHGP